MYTYIPFLSDLPPTPTPIQVTTEHQADLPVLYSGFPLAIYFTHGSVSMSIPTSQVIPPPFPTPRVLLFYGNMNLFRPAHQPLLHGKILIRLSKTCHFSDYSFISLSTVISPGVKMGSEIRVLAYGFVGCAFQGSSCPNPAVQATCPTLKETAYFLIGSP